MHKHMFLVRLSLFALTILLLTLPVPTLVSCQNARPGSAGTRAASPTPFLVLSQSRCQAEGEPTNPETGIAAPSWQPTGYSPADAAWRQGVRALVQQTGACWIELPVLLFQQAPTDLVIAPGASTPTAAALVSGIQYAHQLGLHVFVEPLLQVNGARISWAGALQVSSAHLAPWFAAYWHALLPYLAAAEQAHAEQFALGTELAWLEDHAPDALWEQLIEQAHAAFSGVLTYDRNWDTLSLRLPAWMHAPDLASIGVSAYFPVTETPTRVPEAAIPALWRARVLPRLDDFARQLGKPVFLSEIGYRATADALYLPWQTESSTGAAPDQAEQAAAIGAALSCVLPDPRLAGVFLWGWSQVGAMGLSSSQAIPVIARWFHAF